MQPRSEVRPGLESLQLLVGAQEGLLDDILGVVGIAGHPVRHPIDSPAVALHERPKGLAISVAGQRDGGGVTLDVSFSFVAGRAPQLSGPPEHCHDGEPPDVDILDVTVTESDDPAFPIGGRCVLTDEEEQRFFDDVTGDPPEEDGPDPDDARDNRADDDFDYYGD